MNTEKMLNSILKRKDTNLHMKNGKFVIQVDDEITSESESLEECLNMQIDRIRNGNILQYYWGPALAATSVSLRETEMNDDEKRIYKAYATIMVDGDMKEDIETASKMVQHDMIFREGCENRVLSEDEIKICEAIESGDNSLAKILIEEIDKKEDNDN